MGFCRYYIYCTVSNVTFKKYITQVLLKVKEELMQRNYKWQKKENKVGTTIIELWRKTLFLGGGDHGKHLGGEAWELLPYLVQLPGLERGLSYQNI
jgi:hypothetical protein